MSNIMIESLLSEAREWADGAGESALKSKGDEQKYHWLMGLANIITLLADELEKKNTHIDGELQDKLFCEKLKLSKEEQIVGKKVVQLLNQEGYITHSPTPKDDTKEVPSIELSRSGYDWKKTNQGKLQVMFKDYISFMHDAVPENIRAGTSGTIPYSDDYDSYQIQGLTTSWMISDENDNNKLLKIFEIETDLDEGIDVYFHDFPEDKSILLESSKHSREEMINFCREWFKENELRLLKSTVI